MNLHIATPLDTTPMNTWELVKLDETHQCNALWLAKMHVRKLGTYYAFDRSRMVHCCELTPSYELHVVGVWAEFDGDYGDDDGEVSRAQYDCAYDNPVIYMHRIPERLCRPLMRWITLPERDEGASDDDYLNAIVEATREYINGNEPFFEDTP